MGRDILGETPARPRVTQTLTLAVIKLPTTCRRGLIMGWDCARWVLAIFIFALIRYDLQLSAQQWFWTVLYTVAAVSLITRLAASAILPLATPSPSIFLFRADCSRANRTAARMHNGRLCQVGGLR